MFQAKVIMEEKVILAHQIMALALEAELELLEVRAQLPLVELVVQD